MSRTPSAKRRRLSPPEANGAASPPSADHQSSFFSSAAKWNLEQDYEQRPRKLKGKQKENGRLPIRTTEGWIEQKPAAEEVKEEEDTDSFFGTASEGEDEIKTEEVVEEEPKVSSRQQILEAKEELARIASLLNEDPEEHIEALNTLAQIAASDNATVRKLALATQVAVFQNLIPGYRIRPLSEDSMNEKVSKEVRKLRAFEQKLVSCYQAYVQELAKLAKSGGNAPPGTSTGLASVAIGCACSLLIAVPHFNFRGELLKVLVGKLSTKRVDDDFAKCRETLETLFQNDEDGNTSLDAVTMLTKMMKARDYNVDESVLNTFLHLRLLHMFSLKASYNSVDKPEQQYTGKKIKEKREFRTKRQRKVLKERKVIEKEMQEADAVISHEERDRIQAETLKMVFVAYFRILKARSQKLMGAVLEGLAKYAHLINQDFFGDILEALRELITQAELWTSAEDEDDEASDNEDEDETSARNVTRESLLCVITAFALMQGQDGATATSALKLDLGFFVTHLYRTLYPVSLNPDIERSSKSLHLPDPHAPDSLPQKNKVNVQTTIVLLIRSLSSALLPASAIRAVPPVRLAAFCKQLMTASLQLPEKSSVAMLGLMNQVTKIHGKKLGALWNTEERRGDGAFDPMTAEFEGSNPFATTIWEGELLRLHYSPTVKDAVLGIEKNVHETR
ncbi:nucleolar complex protein-like protein 3 [Polyplosphaeria fusca]|uniref:Nucleolar complex-associated protein 3 n=1 Tax=Polyplosphaeria fusca TaxID=682080 RepID=A0A9P4QXW2_9PLEO|nr:nucleolar complex protein-like protein 3 [Polyplosphaeria fusca]